MIQEESLQHAQDDGSHTGLVNTEGEPDAYSQAWLDEQQWQQSSQAGYGEHDTHHGMESSSHQGWQGEVGPQPDEEPPDAAEWSGVPDDALPDGCHGAVSEELDTEMTNLAGSIAHEEGGVPQHPPQDLQEDQYEEVPEELQPPVADDAALDHSIRVYMHHQPDPNPDFSHQTVYKSGWQNKATLLVALWRQKRYKHLNMIMEKFAQHKAIENHVRALESEIRKWGDQGPARLGYRY